MEADEVGAKQSVQQFCLPWANPESLRIGPGYMPENCDTGIWPGCLHQPWQEREVVILHKDERLSAVLHFVQQGRSKLLVYSLIGFPIRRAERRPGMRNVAERPKTFVRETVVIAGLLFRREPDTSQSVFRIVRRHAKAVELVDVLPVCIAVSGSDPDTVACLEHRLDGCDQPAGRNNTN